MCWHAARSILLIAGLAAVYFAVSVFGLTMAMVSDQVSVVWPATGVALAAVLLAGYRVWPAIAVGAWLANVWSGAPAAVALGIALGNTLEAVAGAWALYALVGFRASLERVRDVAGYVIVGSGLATTISATLGVGSLCLGGLQPWASYRELWMLWWLGDAVGALIVAPLILSWADLRALSARVARPGEAFLLLGILGVIGLAVFAGWLGDTSTSQSFQYLYFPVVIWAALRFGQQGTSLVVFTASAIAIAGTLQQMGPFGGAGVHEGLVQLQSYMAIVALTGLFLSAASQERANGDRRRAAAYGVIQQLAQASSLEQAAPKILEAMCSGLNWRAGTIWTRSAEDDALRLLTIWHRPDQKIPNFERICREIMFPCGTGLPGRVWAAEKPCWIDDVAAEVDFQRSAQASLDGLHGAFGFPVLGRSGVLAVFELFTDVVQPPDEELLVLTTTLGAQISLFVERTAAEEEVRRSRRELDDFFENAVVGLHSVDRNGIIIRANRADYERLGYTRDEYVGQPIARFHTDPELIAGIMARLLKGQPVSNCAATLRCRDGSVRHVLIDANAFKEGSRFVYSRCFSLDVTQLRLAEAALRESELRFRGLADSAPVLIWQNGPDGCEFVNRQYMAFTGLSFGECMGLGWTPCLHPDDAEGYLASYARAEQSRSEFSAQCRFRRHDGQYRWLESRAMPRVDAQGQLLGYVGCSVDITEIKSTEHALRESDRRKDDFIAVLAHELRGPLAPISNALAVLTAIEPGSPEAGPLLELMQRQLRHLVRLIDDLMDVSRIARNKIELRLEKADLRYAVESAVEAARPLLDARRHSIELEIPPGEILVSADETRIVQIIANLLNNAAKFTPPGGLVQVALQTEARQAVLTVRDNGRGIAPEMLSSVFNLFVQADVSVARSQEGLGIGLSLVKSLVELHGGTIEARSAGLGLGSQFVVRLPLLDDAGGGSESAVERPGGDETLEPRRILVVDDTRASAETLALMLRSIGQQVDTAFDGQAAIDRLAIHAYDVVFLDIAMPGMSGYDVARSLRADPRFADGVLVALTGYGQESDRRQALAAGFDHHLIKPTSIAVLRQLLSTVPSRSSA